MSVADPNATDGGPRRYRIGIVARMTGLSAHTIRVWERRYAVVTPDRADGGDRRFSDADVTRLRLLKRLTDAGHSIGNVAHLPDDELRALTHTDPFPALDPSPDALRIRERFLDAILSLDTPFAEQLLSRAAIVLSPRELVYQVVGPLLEEIGERWESGELRVAHEHAATSLLRNLLGQLIRLHVPEVDAPTAIAATPPGERHELGALMAAMLAAVQGWRVVYLGADLPLDELLHGVRRTRAETLLLSIVSGPDGVPELLGAIRAEVPERVRILVGGGAAPTHVPAGVERVAGLEELEQTLRLP